VAKRPDEEPDQPLPADHRNYYEVEQWTRTAPRSIACCMPSR
jgi:hypothetical protein